MDLSDSQLNALNLSLEGKNIFISGLGGTGKTTLAMTIKTKLEESGRNVILTTLEKSDALRIGGITIHELLNLKNNGVDIISQQRVTHPTKLLVAADTIIVDDISKVHIGLFDCLARSLKKAEAKSSAKQLIVLGDFFRTPPFISAEERITLEDLYPNINIEDGHAFKAPAWAKRKFAPVTLDFPQSVDEKKQQVLRCITSSDIGKAINLLEKSRLRYESLFAANICFSADRSDEINSRELDALPSSNITLKAKVKSRSRKHGDIDVFGIPEYLVLKEGAKVVLTEDMNCIGGEPDYHRGSIAIVRKIDPLKYVLVELPNRKQIFIKPVIKAVPKLSAVIDNDGKHRIISSESIVIKQYPLRLAYALDVKSCNGMIFDSAVIMNDDGAQSPSAVYDALSLCSNMDSVHFSKSLDACDLICSDEVLEFQSNMTSTRFRWKASYHYPTKLIRVSEDMAEGHLAVEEALSSIRFSSEARKKALAMLYEMAGELKDMFSPEEDER